VYLFPVWMWDWRCLEFWMLCLPESPSTLRSISAGPRGALGTFCSGNDRQYGLGLVFFSMIPAGQFWSDLDLTLCLWTVQCFGSILVGGGGEFWFIIRFTLYSNVQSEAMRLLSVFEITLMNKWWHIVYLLPVSVSLLGCTLDVCLDLK
jgi:hypothetical protein